MVCPKPLKPGARVALLAPAGPVPADRLQETLDAVRAMGLDPVPGESFAAFQGYLAGSDAVRARDINRAFCDPEITGVICARGGYGTQRLLPLLDFAAIRRAPKRFYGYSDVTALHLAFGQRCGLVTFHTPMPATEWTQPLDDFTLRSLRRALFGPVCGPVGNPPDLPLSTLAPGKAQGRLTGGNLSLVCSTLGTPFEIDTAGKLLFLEEVDEPPYRIDRMLTQLRYAGKLDDSAGVVLGWFKNCEAKTPDRSPSLPTVLADRLAGLGKPVLISLACGHCLPSLSLPLGAAACLDATRGRLTLI